LILKGAILVVFGVAKAEMAALKGKAGALSDKVGIYDRLRPG
jgi:hypothetical protein